MKFALMIISPLSSPFCSNMKSLGRNVSQETEDSGPQVKSNLSLHLSLTLSAVHSFCGLNEEMHCLDLQNIWKIILPPVHCPLSYFSDFETAWNYFGLSQCT